ncbi:MAG TPA: AraC family ligand binding domain-containing protein [Pedobacter sp.]
MKAGKESLEEFYRHKFSSLSENIKQDNGNFNVFNIAERVQTGTVSPTYIRRDFYKIMLFEGTNIFHYGDKSTPVSGNTLLFFNPQVPYTYEPLAEGTCGYFCVFQEAFFKDNQRLNLH